jgi:hypothetical protein
MIEMTRDHTVMFTQYLLPHGKKVPNEFETTKEVADKAKTISDLGYVFEIEILRNGMVSATIGDPIEELDLAFAIHSNGPGLEHAIDKMIMDFSPATILQTEE